MLISLDSTEPENDTKPTTSYESIVDILTGNQDPPTSTSPHIPYSSYSMLITTDESALKRPLFDLLKGEEPSLKKQEEDQSNREMEHEREEEMRLLELEREGGISAVPVPVPNPALIIRRREASIRNAEAAAAGTGRG